MTAASHTFVFTDLVGYTALAESQGDDRAAEVAVEFYRRVRPLLAEHRAEEVKTIGDALMLRCDAPRPAIDLGVRIVGSLQRLPGFPPVRVGIHTGPAVSRDGDWYGTTVNVAARLCAAAGGGEVLVSEATELAAGGTPRRVELDEPRLHWLKNLNGPVAARAATESRRSALDRLEPAAVRLRARFHPHKCKRAQEVAPGIGVSGASVSGASVVSRAAAGVVSEALP